MSVNVLKVVKIITVILALKDLYSPIAEKKEEKPMNRWTEVFYLMDNRPGGIVRLVLTVLCPTCGAECRSEYKTRLQRNEKRAPEWEGAFCPHCLKTFPVNVERKSIGAWIVSANTAIRREWEEQKHKGLRKGCSSSHSKKRKKKVLADMLENRGFHIENLTPNEAFGKQSHKQKAIMQMRQNKSLTDDEFQRFLEMVKKTI